MGKYNRSCDVATSMPQCCITEWTAPALLLYFPRWIYKVSVINLEHEVQGSLGIFSSQESEVRVEPGEVAILRIHQWDQAAVTGNTVLLPTARSPQSVELLPPAFRRCKVWTTDLASRAFFNMVREEFCDPRHANGWLKRMFLPVPNKALCYFYFASQEWSEFNVKHNLEQAPLLFVTYYDRCGHAFAGGCIALGEATSVDVEYQGCVVLGRLVPRCDAELQQMRERGTLVLRSFEDVTHGARRCSRLAKQLRVSMSSFI